MAIIQVDVKKDGRQIKQAFTGAFRTVAYLIGNKLKKDTTPIVKTSGQVIYSVLTNEKNAQPITLLADRRLPQLGALYIENGVTFSGVYFTDATPRFIGARGSLWEWEISYSIGGEFSNASQTGNNGNEEKKGGGGATTLLSFSTSIELEDYATAADLDGEWNCNSIGEFFADPLIVKTGILNLNYSRREYSNPMAISRGYFQAINNADIWGFQRGTLKVSDISFSATQTTEETTYEVNYKIQYRPRSWFVEKANAGLYCVNSKGNVRRALNADGSPVDQPVLLNLNGTQLPSGIFPYVKKYRVNNWANFHALNLPDPFEV